MSNTPVYTGQTVWNIPTRNLPVTKPIQVSISGSGSNSSQLYSYQLTSNGAGIFPTTITPPKSEVDVQKEKIEAFDRAMRGVG